MTKLPFGLWFLKARSATFPASANMTAVLDRGEITLFDAGGSGEENHAATRAALESMGHTVNDVARVLLTHAHADHSGGISLLRAARPDVSVLIHPRAARMIESREAFLSTFDFALIRELYPDAESQGRRFADGLERFLVEGACPFEPVAKAEALDAGSEVRAGSLSFQVLLGEGHAPGHVMFYEPEAKVLIAGDTVGTRLSWHSPSSGGVSAYLDALERAAGLDVDVILPAHGPILEDARARIEALSDKLRRREDKILGWLRETERSFAELRVLMTGSDGEQGLFPSVPMLEGHLQRLERAGRIRREGGSTATSLRIEFVA